MLDSLSLSVLHNILLNPPPHAHFPVILGFNVAHTVWMIASADGAQCLTLDAQFVGDGMLQRDPEAHRSGRSGPG